jgi:hypothetical protein
MFDEHLVRWLRRPNGGRKKEARQMAGRIAHTQAKISRQGVTRSSDQIGSTGSSVSWDGSADEICGGPGCPGLVVGAGMAVLPLATPVSATVMATTLGTIACSSVAATCVSRNR